MQTCLSGADRFFEEPLPAFRGMRIGLIANPASVDAHYTHTADRFAACPELHLVALFGPQHGAMADKQDNMIESPDATDARLGIPVYSLYGSRRKPAPAMLENIDALVCDLPDVGARPYTFLTTMLLAMEACAESGRRFIVLDHPNPISGAAVEGNVLDPAFRSFIGPHPLPMRHGMTMGELATLVNRERHLGADLQVVELKNWRRDSWMDETALPWIMPSPNMPTLGTAAVYPGTVLIEGTNLSEGRGTTRPFELIGAPFVDARRLAACLNELGLPGVHFRAVWFRPTFDKWCGELCGGVQVHVTGRLAFRPYLAGLAILKVAMELHPDAFAWRRPPFEYELEMLPIDMLTGSDTIRRQLDRGADLEWIESSWQAGLREFCALRENYLRY